MSVKALGPANIARAAEMMVRLYNPSLFVLCKSCFYLSNSGVYFPTRLLQQLEAHERPVTVFTDMVGNPNSSDVRASAGVANWAGCS